MNHFILENWVLFTKRKKNSISLNRCLSIFFHFIWLPLLLCLLNEKAFSCPFSNSSWQLTHNLTSGTAFCLARGISFSHSSQWVRLPLGRRLRANSRAFSIVASICSWTDPSRAHPMAIVFLSDFCDLPNPFVYQSSLDSSNQLSYLGLEPLVDVFSIHF